MGEVNKTAGRALYRVHRSHNFDEVVGQDHVVQTLKQAIADERLSHAYLFTGPRGVGKTSVARILAHTINGLSYNDESLQLDVIEIDAASNRGIDEIRELREKVHIAPAEAKYKVYIIDEVHMLTTPAFNALLKTLEEPPGHAVFVLATTEPHKIPETITSRTQRFAFRPIIKEEITKHLDAVAGKEGIKLEPQANALMAQHADGSLRDAIGFLDQLRGRSGTVTVTDVEELLGLAPTDHIQQLVSQLQTGDLKAMLKTLEAVFATGASPVQTALQLVDALRLQLHQKQKLDAVLFNDLLAVATSREPQLKLEVALARACLDQTAPPVADKTPTPSSRPAKSKRSTPTSTAKPAARSQAEPSSDEKKAKADTAPLPGDKWQQILEQIKSHNNSLYAVLRLAKAEHGDSQLVLAFAFPFHAARAEEPRNKRLLEQTANEVTGQELTISTKLDKSLQSNTRERDTVTNVIGVMGGGSVVEYKDG